MEKILGLEESLVWLMLISSVHHGLAKDLKNEGVFCDWLKFAKSGNIYIERFIMGGRYGCDILSWIFEKLDEPGMVLSRTASIGRIEVFSDHQILAPCYYEYAERRLTITIDEYIGLHK